MICPECLAKKSKLKVVDSRGLPDGRTRRRYLCLRCGVRFTTYEEHDIRSQMALGRLRHMMHR